MISTVILPTGGLSVVERPARAASCEASSGIAPAPPSHAVSLAGSISHAKTSAAGAAISTRPFVSMPMGDNLARRGPILG